MGRNASKFCRQGYVCRTNTQLLCAEKNRRVVVHQQNVALTFNAVTVWYLSYCDYSVGRRAAVSSPSANKHVRKVNTTS
jgi:hypothetical protein